MKNVLKNVFFKDKLEEMLTANWTEFLDSSKLLAYVLTKIQENANDFKISEIEEKPFLGVRITISRFSSTKEGFVFWVEFSAPFSSSEIVEGTMELLLNPFEESKTNDFNLYKGSISYISMLGNIYRLKK